MKTTYKIVVIVLISLTVSYGKPIDLSMGARPAAMGGAFSAIADDANTPYWNPAGMSLIGSLKLAITNQINPEFMSTNYNLVSGVFPLKDFSVGFSWLMQNATLEAGDPDNPLDYTEDLWREHHFSLAFAYQLWKTFLIFRETSIGINLNRYSYSTSSYHGAGVGFDAALRTAFPYDISLGIVVRSIAADIEGEMFEPEYRIGLGYSRTFAKMHKLTIASDASVKKDIEYANLLNLEATEYNVKLHEGIEYTLLLVKNFTPSLRLGTNLFPVSEREGGMLLNLNGGIGLNYKNYTIDYAVKYNLQEEYGLGMFHQVTFIFSK